VAIYTFEGPMGSGMTMYGLALVHMQAQITKRQVVSNYLEIKYNSSPFDEAMEWTLRSKLRKNLDFIAREEQEIERAIRRRPWLLTLGENERRHLPKKPLECDIYYEGRKLGSG
jgi:hypothetical protein